MLSAEIFNQHGKHQGEWDSDLTVFALLLNMDYF